MGQIAGPSPEAENPGTAVGTGRLEAFSDGVLAVAITLLVLGLHVPAPGHGALAAQLARVWSSFAAYLVSFFVIGIIWVNHHAVLHDIARVDLMAMFVNLLVLLFVTAIPFLDRDPGELPSPRRPGRPPGSSDLWAACARRGA